MFFLPFTILIFILFILSLPFLFFLGYFHIIVVGFQNLGISPRATLLILFLILVGSLVNIPLTPKKIVKRRRSFFFGLFSRPEFEIHCVAINLGGAIIPVLISLYFLVIAQMKGFELKPILIATLLITVISKLYSRVVPGRGIVLPAFIPPLFSSICALILSPSFAAPTAFISGVLGTLIGGDLLNLREIQRYGGFISIGGAGIFDGIFLVGIVSALLSGW